MYTVHDSVGKAIRTADHRQSRRQMSSGLSMSRPRIPNSHALSSSFDQGFTSTVFTTLFSSADLHIVLDNTRFKIAAGYHLHFHSTGRQLLN